MKNFRYKKNFNQITLLTFLLTMIGCKFEFNQDDLILYNTYEENELLIFESNRSELDTFKITSKNIYYNSWTPIERDGKYNPPNAVIKYEKLNLNNYKIFNQNREKYENPALFHIWKRSPDSPARVGLKFQNFYHEFEMNNNTLPKAKLSYKGKEIDCFVLIDNNLWEDEDVETIYLSTDYNIIRYDTGSGDVWIRIN